MKTFNVIVQNFNTREFVPYNVIPYLVETYKKSKKKLTSKEEFKKFVKNESMYQWWARCEYEIILSGWPNVDDSEKVDVYWQIMLNLDLITELLMESV